MSETGDSSSISITDMEDNIVAISPAAGNAAADTKEEPKARRNRMRMVAERKRRNRVKNCFGELRALMPHVSDKCDKPTLVGHTIDYIQSLENTLAMLENRKQEQALTRQVVAAEGAASSSSAPPQTAQEMAAPAAMVSDVPEGCHNAAAPPLQQPLAAALPMSADVVPQPQPLIAAVAAVPAPRPQLATAATGHVGFKTWSWPNLVLNVSLDHAYINVWTPRHFGMENMMTVLSVLNTHGIDVVMVQVDSDAARSLLNIYARVTRKDGENPSSEDVYKLAVSEILLLLNTN